MQSKKLESVPFTAKASKVSKNSSKGELLEAKKSAQLHLAAIPVLVSPKLLRTYGCGQVDLVIYERKSIKIFEVKSHPMSVSMGQRIRLQKSADFIAQVMSSNAHIVFIN